LIEGFWEVEENPLGPSQLYVPPLVNDDNVIAFPAHPPLGAEIIGCGKIFVTVTVCTAIPPVGEHPEGPTCNVYVVVTVGVTDIVDVLGKIVPSLAVQS